MLLCLLDQVVQQASAFWDSLLRGTPQQLASCPAVQLHGLAHLRGSRRRLVRPGVRQLGRLAAELPYMDLDMHTDSLLAALAVLGRTARTSSPSILEYGELMRRESSEGRGALVHKAQHAGRQLCQPSADRAHRRLETLAA